MSISKDDNHKFMIFRKERNTVIRLSRRITKLFKSVFIINDLKRWREVDNETSKWDQRNELIASFIPDNQSVLDIGSGAQTLKHYLKNSKEYTPCDLIPAPGTLFCDLNREIYPQVSHRYDFVVCSGVIEYLLKPKRVISYLPNLGNTIILTYAPTKNGQKTMDRIYSGWKNHYSKEHLEIIFSKCNLSWYILGEWKNQIVYLLQKQ